jgi:hypothetical protein
LCRHCYMTRKLLLHWDDQEFCKPIRRVACWVMKSFCSILMLFFLNVCYEMCVTFYICVRSCVFSYQISCDGAMFSLCAEIQKCDENGEIWRLYWSNYILKFFLFYAQKWIAWTLIFHFSSITMGTQSTFFYDLSDGWIKYIDNV